MCLFITLKDVVKKTHHHLLRICMKYLTTLHKTLKKSLKITLTIALNMQTKYRK